MSYNIVRLKALGTHWRKAKSWKDVFNQEGKVGVVLNAGFFSIRLISTRFFLAKVPTPVGARNYAIVLVLSHYGE
jgi:hypothetical protein